MAQPPKIRTAPLISSTDGGTRNVPVESQVNGGQGIQFYLGKLDANSGKRLFYRPEEWRVMTDAQRAEAMDHTVKVEALRVGQSLSDRFDHANADEQAALLDKLADALAARQAQAQARAKAGK